MARHSIWARGGLALLAGAAALPAHAAWTLNMPWGVTNLQHKVYDLHMMMFGICVVIGVGVFGTMLFSIVRHRKSRGVEAANFHESTWVEITWTIIPFLILVAVAIPAAGTLITIENSSDPDMTIRVTAHQWLWEYKYVDAGVHFYSRLDAKSNAARRMGSGINPDTVPHYLQNVDHPMVVPAHEKVRLLLTSADVNHAWWVPKLGGKKDAIPGFINDMWFKANKIGTYRGQCAELCGRGHAFMPIVVKVVSKADYAKWLARQGGHLPYHAGAKPVANQSASAQALSKPAGQHSAAGTSDAGSRGGESGGQSASHASAQGSANTDKQAAAQTPKMTKAELMKQGAKIYGNTCASCHQPNGKGLPAAGFPAMAGDKIVNGPVAGHIKQVLTGGGAMPPFAKALSDAQIAAVVTYERNSFGNTTGDVVQPSQVEKQR